jgi:outer membrane receptor protein involved in Fe transport
LVGWWIGCMLLLTWPYRAASQPGSPNEICAADGAARSAACSAGSTGRQTDIASASPASVAPRRGGGAVALPANGVLLTRELKLLRLAWDNHRAVVGIELHDNLDASSLADTGIAPPLADPRLNVGLVARDEWQLRPGLAATLGLRVEYENFGNRTHFRPRAGLVWQAAPGMSINLRYGRAPQSLGAAAAFVKDLRGAVDNGLVGGEPVDALQFDAEQRFGPDTRLRAAAFVWTARGAAGADGVALDGESQAAAGSTVEARGFELSAEHAWAAIGARLRGSALWQGMPSLNGTPMPLAPRVMGKLALSTPLPWAGLQLGCEWLYSAGRVSGDGGGSTLLSNLTLGSKSLVDGLQLSVTVVNLLDVRDALPIAEAGAEGLVAENGRGMAVNLLYRF